MQLNAGRLLQGGKYIINHPLETQGFGITYLGTQTDGGQSVVLKTLHPALYKSRAYSRLRDRFVHLSCELTRCSHPSLVRVIELFQEGDWPFMVLEYIHGKPLNELVQPSRPLAEMEALHYIRSVGGAIAASHHQNLVHGNLKPENIIRRAGSNVCITVGYGISAERMLAAVQYAVPGFPHTFTAPEQIGSDGNRLRSADIYGLSGLLYYMLTGHAPLDAIDRAKRPVKEHLPLLAMIKPSLQQVIRQGLALEPQNRPPSVDGWLKLLPQTNELKTTAKPKVVPTKIQAETQIESPQTQLEISTTKVEPPEPVTAAPQPAPQPVATTAPPKSVVPDTVLEVAESPDVAAPDVVNPITAEAPLPEPVVESEPVKLPERPRFRQQPIESPAEDPFPERPRLRDRPMPSSNSDSTAVAAGVSIAPPRPAAADQQLRQRPTRPYTKLPPQRQGERRGWLTLKRSLLLCTGIAALSGISFGLILRFNAVKSPAGGGLFDSEQSFPNRKWEGTLAPTGYDDAPIEDPAYALPPRQPTRSRPEESATFDRTPIIEEPAPLPTTEPEPQIDLPSLRQPRRTETETPTTRIPNDPESDPEAPEPPINSAAPEPTINDAPAPAPEPLPTEFDRLPSTSEPTAPAPPAE